MSLKHFVCLQTTTGGEQKTKPTQASVRELRGLGLAPDLVCCRSRLPLEASIREKLSLFCDVEPEQVIQILTGSYYDITKKVPYGFPGHFSS